MKRKVFDVVLRIASILVCCSFMLIGCTQAVKEIDEPSAILVDDLGFESDVSVIKVTADDHEYLIFMVSGKYGIQVVHNEGCPCKEKED